MADNTSFKTLAQNRKARYDYFVVESFEAGIELKGTEVKSIRSGSVSLKEAWCSVTSDLQLYVKQMHIAPYEQGNIFNQDPLRERRLLMHKRQIRKLSQELSQEGHTLIPLSVYLKDSLVKVQVGLCKGKRQYDKRESIAKREAQRTISRALKESNQ